jgi:two-component system, NtrC family, response regulator AtoC
MNEQIIIIEDDGGVRFFLEEALKGEGYAVSSYESYEDAYISINRNIALIIMDIKLPGVDGLTAIDEIKKKVNTPIIIITAFGTKKNAMEAIERGATDFFIKPIALDELKIIVKRVLHKKGIEEAIERTKEEALSDTEHYGIIGKSASMKEIFRTADKIAEKDISVLITGETGVGKEVIAHLIHRLSKRKGMFVVVNCASIPDNLLESELFGYERGAFTGASQTKQGKFELADNGTIVLDEIGEMSPYLQAKLLRVIETREIERLGGLKNRKVDLRIMATTNRILETEIKGGKFREDLFHRLSQIHIMIPPLRERKEDINHLIDRFLLDASKETGEFIKIESAVKKIMLEHEWPGNVRELINVIKRSSIMCEGGIVTIDDLPLYLRGNFSVQDIFSSGKTLDDAISEVERKMITDALNRTKGHQARAAKLLGITKRSMWYRVKKYNVETLSE